MVSLFALVISFTGLQVSHEMQFHVMDHQSIQRRTTASDESVTPLSVGFDTVQDAVQVLDAYSSDGLLFSPSALVLKGMVYGGCCGDFSDTPSGDTSAMTIYKSEDAIIDIQRGFVNGVSLYYSSVHKGAKVGVYFILGETRELLAELDLPKTLSKTVIDPSTSETYDRAPFAYAYLNFTGVANALYLHGRGAYFDDVNLSLLPLNMTSANTSSLNSPINELGENALTPIELVGVAAALLSVAAGAFFGAFAGTGATPTSGGEALRRASDYAILSGLNIGGGDGGAAAVNWAPGVASSFVI